jgi:TatD DNase family protein
MIDIGVNLTNTRFDKDRDELIARAKSAGIRAMLVTGTNISESHKALQLSAQYPDYLYTTAGIHPHDADNVSDNYLDDILTVIFLLQSNKKKCLLNKYH